MLQSTNACPSILVTLSGTVMLVKPLHPENASNPILATPLGIVYIPDFPAGQCNKVSIFLSNNTPSWDVYAELSGSTINSLRLQHSEKA